MKKVVIDTMGVKCSYKLESVNPDGTTETTEYTQTSNRPPHPDLLKHVEELGKIAAQIIGVENASVTHITLSGKGDKKGIAMSGYIRRVKFSIPTVRYGSNDSEVAVKLTVIVAALEEEIKKYLFDDKYASEGVLGE